MAPRNLVNLKSVSKGFASRSVLDDVTLGINAGDRIGIVGKNGDGKSTLLRLIAGLEEPDSGAVTRNGDLHMAMIVQGDALDPEKSIREELLGSRDDHEWAGDPRFREVLGGLLGGVEMTRFPKGPETLIGPLSGGERRRISLAKLLLDSPDLLLLDEPTNHLDVEAVDWLAHHLANRRGSMVVITHDRWFLDAVVNNTWEVVDGTVHQYEGGYAAYVLARAERDRQAAASDARRRQLLRKELAWLRRGPPARTSKPKFRIDAANELIADEPQARDSVELLRFASSRLGNKVIDAIDVSVKLGERTLLNDATWRLGPGDRVALVGVNGSGKTTLLNVLSGKLKPSSGQVQTGATVKLAYRSQDTAEIPGHLRVLESLEEVKGMTTTSDGQEQSASQLCERFGFAGPKSRTLVKDLSGGERRRLQLMRLLMDQPNVLLLDEPTNDLDIDTLTALEDLLDSWPGTLVVVSHDRYFVERVCDNVYALSKTGAVDHLPRGIDQYIEQRRAAEAGGSPGKGGSGKKGSAAQVGSAGSSGNHENPAAKGTGGASSPTDSTTAAPKKPAVSGAARRDAQKEIKRCERELAKLETRETELHEEMAAASSEYSKLRELSDELEALKASREELELAWMEASELVEG